MATLALPGSGIPVELTRFIGREREIAAVRQLLAGTRLLTLTGAGGSGKTRLALELAAQLADEYPHGVVWVEVAPLSSPELIPQQIAAALDIREAGGRSALELVQEHLRERHLLLVLDNCEHLVEECARLAELLLRGCPALHLLATSREALGVVGERAWLTPGLSVPEDRLGQPAAVAGAEAVQLFVERAQDALPSFQLTEANAAWVAQICRRLDGIPLALELAAARVRVLTPEQIAERLGDAFRLLTGGRRTTVPRQQTLRAAMDWSHQLLAAPEQKLLQRLSVFVGGFSIEAAEAVCADEHIESFEILDLLSVLVDKSLVSMQVRQGEARYALLETVRQYAGERLREAGQTDAFRRSHASFFLALAEDYDPLLIAPLPWRQRCEGEHDNLRAALRGALDHGEAEIATRLAAALRPFWYAYGHISEGRRWLGECLAAGGPCAPDVRARALISAGILTWIHGDWGKAESLFLESLRLFRELGDPRWIARALNRVGVAAMELGRLEEADQRLEESWRLSRSSGDGPWMSQVLNAWGQIAYARGDFERAKRLFEEGLPQARVSGIGAMVSSILSKLGRIALIQGDPARAEALLIESLRTVWELGSYDAAMVLTDLAGVAGAQGHAERAARLFGAAEAHFAVLGAPVSATNRPLYERNRAAARARLDPAAWDRAWQQGYAMPLEPAVEYARAGSDTREAANTAPEAPPAPATDRPIDPPVQQAGTPPLAPVPIPPTLPAAEPETGRGPAFLRVVALGPLQIQLEGRPLPGDAWTYARPRELLLYLLAHPRGRTREQIGLAFWPEASTAQVKNSFHVTLHHLRKTLGRSDCVVFAEERYRINAELGVEFDTLVFEEQITAALREVRSGARTVAPERLASVLGLYRGDFLVEEGFGDWHLETRDHLAHLYLEGMLALGELLMQQARWVEAAEVYQRLVRKEDLHEEAHRHLMRCWAEAGERSRSLKHYERLVTLLREELDTEPEQETTALYERLKRVVAA